jgi:hypothetical protein
VRVPTVRSTLLDTFLTHKSAGDCASALSSEQLSSQRAAAKEWRQCAQLTQCAQPCPTILAPPPLSARPPPLVTTARADSSSNAPEAAARKEVTEQTEAAARAEAARGQTEAAAPCVDDSGSSARAIGNPPASDVLRGWAREKFQSACAWRDTALVERRTQLLHALHEKGSGVLEVAQRKGSDVLEAAQRGVDATADAASEVSKHVGRTVDDVHDAVVERLEPSMQHRLKLRKHSAPGSAEALWRDWAGSARR